MYDWLTSDKTIKSLFSANNKTGKPKSKSAIIKEFAAELNRVAMNTRESTFTHSQLTQLFQVKFGETNTTVSLSEILESMNHHGHLLKKPGNIYKLMST